MIVRVHFSDESSTVTASWTERQGSREVYRCLTIPVVDEALPYEAILEVPVLVISAMYAAIRQRNGADTDTGE
jgi:hypothetical protein